MKYFDYFYENLRNYPDTLLFKDKDNSLTNNQADSSSAKIFNYLYSNNFKAEDVIAIKIKKSIKVPIAILGILKAGCALVVFGDNIKEENEKSFLLETKPKLILDEPLFDKIVASYKEKQGYIESEPHALALIIYSSSSSGFFKGSMLEYGQLEKLISHLVIDYPDLRTCALPRESSLIYSFYDVTGMCFTLSCFVSFRKYYIVPDTIIYNPQKLKETIIENDINIVILPPYIFNDKSFFDGLKLKWVYVALEPSSNLYIEGVHIYNLYGMTEALFDLLYFEIDKPYDITPIGKPCPDVEAFIADEDGNKLEDGSIGQIAFKTQYFRGYIGKEEETKKVLKGNVFLTGDIAKVLPDGNFVVYGRKIDITKTKNGYIIPYLISFEIKKAFNISWCYVKIFENSKNRIICLYVKKGTKISINSLREKLKGKLDAESVPNCIIEMDNIPRFESGKTNRNGFPIPKEFINK